MEKKLELAFKEGGKKGQDLAGMSDLGGMKFFTVVLENCQGKVELVYEALRGMNQKVDPEDGERKGGAGELAKLLLSAGDDSLVMVCQVDGEVENSLNSETWMNSIMESLHEDSSNVKKMEDGTLLAVVEKKPEKFPLKMRDTAVNTSFGLLRQKGLVADDSDEDVDLGALHENAGIEW